MIAGVLSVSVSFGLLLAYVGGITGLLIGVLVAAVALVWVIATLPSPPPARMVWTERQFNPDNGPTPCALCGYNCIPGGFWTIVPGHMNAVMHTISCGPMLPGEEPLAASTHRRDEGGRYWPIGS
jgi:hypothetical protein